MGDCRAGRAHPCWRWMHRRRPFLASALAALAVLATGGPQAHAGDTIGAAYSGSGGEACDGPVRTYVQTESPGNSHAFPYDGVVTSWATRGFLPTFTFNVVRLGSGSSYTVIAADGPRSYGSASGLVTYPVRMSVRQGDVLGGHTPGSHTCPHTGTGFGLGVDDVAVAPGGTGSFDSTNTGRVPIEATIERDSDGDGYGDDSQDDCPTNASTQGPCPLPTVLGQTFSPITSASTGDTVVTGSLVSKIASQQDGVITSWSYQANSVVGGTMKLKMFRPLGGNDYRAVGAAQPQTPVANSLNTYPTRISVRQGDKIGARHENLPITSNVSSPANSAAFFANDLATGDSATFTPTTCCGRRIDISAVLEADADGDGYGDTSQDLCPTDASTQGACPAAQPPPPDTSACDAARAKLDKAKAKLKKLKRKDASAKKLTAAKKKVKKAKTAVEEAC